MSITPISISTERYFNLSRQIETHHSLFYMMWEMGRPFFSDDIPTAGVRFDEYGERVQFLFNPDFWEKLEDDYNRLFVICHESLHVILNHGVRIASIKTSKDAANACLDIVVNHSLIRSFGFEREKIKNADSYCWVDTVFKDQDLPTDECFEFYYNKLPKINYPVMMLDDHSCMEGMPAEGIEKLVGEIDEKMCAEEKEALRDLVQTAGTEAGNMWRFVDPGEVVQKRKWESVIQKWCSLFMGGYKEVEQWTRVNRRFVFLGDDLILPTEMEIEHEEEQRIEVWFFLDTSGSCYNLKDRFFRAALSLPKDRFDVRALCFDTKVYEVDLKAKKLYGFGGTRYDILEEYIQAHCGKEYPRAVFVLTDGYGSPINPKNPRVWHWFLTTNSTYYIPKDSCIHYLKDFE